jgi:hypothetical protein
MQNNDVDLLNCGDEVWNQSLVKGKLKFKMLHVRNNAKMHDQEDGSSSKANMNVRTQDTFDNFGKGMKNDVITYNFAMQELHELGNKNT